NEKDSPLLKYLDDYTRGRYFESDDHWDLFLQYVYDQIIKQIGLNRSPNISSVEVEPSIVKIGNEVQVNMKASDPDGDELSYKWEAVL
ncbi:hypothetical protein CVR96_28200, partial [Salmonella enterica subsp. enterica serovar Typhimurium]|uniref:hypothetical protein n=1 Tax=Salmonella enterica TaxID=28901 RepID=UPI000CC31AC4